MLDDYSILFGSNKEQKEENKSSDFGWQGVIFEECNGFLGNEDIILNKKFITFLNWLSYKKYKNRKYE